MDTKGLPPEEAKRILDEYEKDQVIIWTYDSKAKQSTLTYCGSNDAQSEDAHQKVLAIIEALKDKILDKSVKHF